MNPDSTARRADPAVCWFAAAALVSGLAAARGPAEVTGVLFDDPQHLGWNPLPGAEEYIVYGGSLHRLASGVLLSCYGDKVGEPPYRAEAVPEPGAGLFYIVTGKGQTGEGTPGASSSGIERYLGGSCRSVLRNHVLDRSGFGWSEWSRDRIETLGAWAYVEEQLDPVSIDESTNAELIERLAGLDPPETIQELQALDLVRAVYSRRQLEQAVTLFWSNHFNTDYGESYRFFSRYNDDLTRKRREATLLHYDELERFRARAFDGSFREMLGVSALSPAMNIFLDTNSNVAGRPNENYARELLELYTMGVDGGYTHHEIDEIARVLTGWNVCKKLPADAGDFLAPCIPNSVIGTVDEPDGRWVINFRKNRHDCGEKMLFPGTAYETLIPDTCSNRAAGAQDLFTTLDVLALHPSTATFIATKLLRHFVTDEPTPAMIDAVLAAWNDAANPHGTGDLREVLREVLRQMEALDVDSVRAKIKTPFEHVASALRATRGRTNGTSVVRNYLLRMQQPLHQNPIPTGYPERGDEWIDTNNILERMNLGMDLAGRSGVNFGADIPGLLGDHGVDTGPGHAAEIVDFFLDVLFGGNQTSAQRQAAIDVLSTDDGGAAADYDATRIRETVGFLLGCPEFMEQ